MNSAGIVLVVLLLSWGSSALPCETCWGGTETEIVGAVIPAEEIVYVPASEEDEIVSVPEPIIVDSSSSESDGSGVVVEAPNEEEIFSVRLCESNPAACAVAEKSDEDDDDSSEEVETTTVKV